MTVMVRLTFSSDEIHLVFTLLSVAFNSHVLHPAAAYFGPVQWRTEDWSTREQKHRQKLDQLKTTCDQKDAEIVEETKAKLKKMEQQVLQELDIEYSMCIEKAETLERELADVEKKMHGKEAELNKLGEKFENLINKMDLTSKSSENKLMRTLETLEEKSKADRAEAKLKTQALQEQMEKMMGL